MNTVGGFEGSQRCLIFRPRSSVSRGSEVRTRLDVPAGAAQGLVRGGGTWEVAGPSWSWKPPEKEPIILTVGQCPWPRGELTALQSCPIPPCVRVKPKQWQYKGSFQSPCEKLNFSSLVKLFITYNVWCKTEAMRTVGCILYPHFPMRQIVQKVSQFFPSTQRKEEWFLPAFIQFVATQVSVSS